MAKKKSRAMYARNSSQVIEQRAKLKESVARNANYSTVRLRGEDGKMHQYHQRVDSRGRKYIVNTGGVAPQGYYGVQGARNYAKTDNIRLSRQSSANLVDMARGERKKFLKGVASASLQGQISKVRIPNDLEYDQARSGTQTGVVANFRKTGSMRRMMEAWEATDSNYHYQHAGTASRKMSKYAVLFGQDGHCI